MKFIRTFRLIQVRSDSVLLLLCCSADEKGELTTAAAPAPQPAASAAAGSPETKSRFGVYDLYGVVNHFGASGGGHYVTYALSQKDGRWYSFNDSHVTPIQESDVITSAAYMLFYQRRGLPPRLEFLPDVRTVILSTPTLQSCSALLCPLM